MAVCDFGGATGVPHPTFRYAGWAQLSMLQQPVSRESLLADPVLEAAFRNIQGPPRPLTAEQGAALQRLIGDGPPRRTPRPPTWKQRRSALTNPWRPGGFHGDWVNEAEIENHIAADPRTWRRLGFLNEPMTQKWLNPRDRPDLCGVGVVAEIKLKAAATDIAQLQRYMRSLDEHPQLGALTRCRGLLITGHDRANPSLLAAVAEAAIPVELWSVCRGSGRSGARVRLLGARSDARIA